MSVIKNTDWTTLPMPLKEQKFRSLTTAMVDGDLWHTVQCKPEVSKWLREQPGENTMWFQNIDQSWMMNMNTFDVHLKMYVLIVLKWGGNV